MRFKPGTTTYRVSVSELKQMFAEDLKVDPLCITISANNREVGDQRESYTVFDGVTVEVDHSKQPTPRYVERD